MKRIIICVTVIVMAIFPLMLSLSSFDTNAYLTPSSFSTYRSSSPYDYSASYDGIYLFQTTYKSFYGPDTISSPAMLNSSHFVSGTWNGQKVDELDSKNFYDIDVSGFSQAFSYTDEGGFFVYSMITCLPVKAGDRFRISFKANSVNVREFSYHSLYSYVPGGSGCRMVHFEYGEHPDSPLSYTVRSANQHLVLVLNPDTFNSSSGFFKPSQSCNCTSFSGLTSVGYNADCTDFFTTPYNYPAGSDVSVTLKDDVDNYSFSVYEIFTDGTLTPGFNTEGETSTTSPSGTPGSSGGVSVDLSGVLAKLDEIRQAINNKVVEVTVNVSSAVQEKLDSIIDFLCDLPADMWDSFKVGLAEMFRITEDVPEPEPPPSEPEPDEEPTETTTATGISIEIDNENFDKAMQEVNIDNLGVNIAGNKGAMAFFWYLTDKFFDCMGLYTVVFISLFLAFCTWLLRS